ncbi:MAG: hypothetical protein K6G38_04475 [Gammaproteobacteria bacterium]|nr:hypothetical protein [Gammaproteobacteria bacterium]
MKKITFKNKVLNLVTAGFFLVAAIIALIGLLGVDALNFLGGKGLYYIVGVSVLVFAGINMFASFRKANHKNGNIAVFVINAIIMVFGVILFILGVRIAEGKLELDDIFFLFQPAVVFGLVLYAEGILLVLLSKYNETTTIKRTFCGVLSITLGVCAIIWLRGHDQYISFFLDAILFLIGIFYFIIGLKPIIDRRKYKGVSKAEQEATEEVKAEVVSPKIEHKQKKEKEVKVEEVSNSPQIEHNNNVKQIETVEISKDDIIEK